MRHCLWLLLVIIASIGDVPIVATESDTPYQILSTLSEDDSVIAVVRKEQILFLLYDQTIIGAEFDHPYLRKQAAFPAFGIMQCVAYLDCSKDRVIQVGLGIGTVPSFLREQGIVTDVVEISSAVVRQATNYFQYERCTSEDPNECVHGETFITDGLAFIDAYPPKPTHDVFIIDVYTGRNPFAFFVREVLETIETKWLKPNGVLVLNFVGFIHGSYADVPKSIYKTLLSLFKIVKCFREIENGMDKTEAMNIVYYASNKPITFTLPEHDDYADPPPNTYFYAIQNFQKWEIFQELQEESNVEVEMHQSPNTDDVAFNSNRKSHVQILTRADHGQAVFEETHRYTQEHMRERVIEQFPNELWEELGIDI